MSLLPSSPDVAPDGEPRVVGLDSEEADDLMAALSSTTARRLLAELHEEPAPPGELADRVDTSLQNAQYHLENLEEAGAIEVVGTAYSEKGREMRVYGPADSPLVIFAGEKERASGLRAALSRLFGGFAALALASLAIQQAFGERLLAGTGDEAVPAGETATPTPTSEGGAAGGGDTGDGGDEGGPGAFDAEETSTETYTRSGEETSAGTETPQETAQPSPTVEEADSGATSGSPTETASGADDGAAEPAATDAMDTATETATETAGGTTPTPAGDEFDVFGVLEAALGSGLPPGLAFFLGGATVLTLFVATTYVRAQP